MASVFRLDDNHVDKPNRNTYDLSYANNLTLNFGNLTPVYRQRVYPGDGIKIDPKFALRMLPQVFPVQTRQRASLKFYYVRNRNLWKDFPDFIGKTKTGLVSPYLDLDNPYYLRPSGICDYMGLPVKVYPVAGSDNKWPARQPWIRSTNGNMVYVPNSATQLYSKGLPQSKQSIETAKNIGVRFLFPTSQPSGIDNMAFRLDDWYGGEYNNDLIAAPKAAVNGLDGYTTWRATEYTKIDINLFRIPLDLRGATFNGSSARTIVILRLDDGTDVYQKLTMNSGGQIPSRVNFVTLRDKAETGEDGVDYDVESREVASVVGFMYMQDDMSNNTPLFPTELNNAYVDSSVDDIYWCDVAASDVPYASRSNPNGKRISALPFRAYQSIYNALIRNAENNPFRINGVEEYNKYIPSDDGGMSTDDDLIERFANWADDRFTTALPSPQQGNAPLVGLSGTQGAVLTIGNEDGTQQQVRLSVDSETGYVVGVDASASTASEDIISEAWNAVDYGISINDFRNVNAYQRWKENNIRRGYKYKDQISAHYGVSVRFEVLDMPEFIGGVSRDINVEQVTQTVENEYGVLGEYGGQSYIMGDGHSISHYCDEHGWIIGILSVVPMPLYHDTLSKDFIASDPFDYYFPEFGKIGPQPILNQEIAFSQSVKKGVDENTFGYQRAWYDHLERLDEVHGLYRSDFRNYLLGREFGDVPELGYSFLTVNSQDINNTFYSEDTNDKILGQLYFDVKMKRPIPLYGIPAIE